MPLKNQSVLSILPPDLNGGASSRAPNNYFLCSTGATINDRSLQLIWYERVIWMVVSYEDRETGHP